MSACEYPESGFQTRIVGNLLDRIVSKIEKCYVGKEFSDNVESFISKLINHWNWFGEEKMLKYLFVELQNAGWHIFKAFYSGSPLIDKYISQKRKNFKWEKSTRLRDKYRISASDLFQVSTLAKQLEYPGLRNLIAPIAQSAEPGGGVGSWIEPNFNPYHEFTVK